MATDRITGVKELARRKGIKTYHGNLYGKLEEARDIEFKKEIEFRKAYNACMNAKNKYAQLSKLHKQSLRSLEEARQKQHIINCKYLGEDPIKLVEEEKE